MAITRLRILLLSGATALGAAGVLGAGALAEDCSTSGCRADVDISGHAEPQPIYLGDESEFKFTAKNDGPAGAKNIELQAVIPTELQILKVDVFGGPGCTPKGNFIDCFLGDFVREQEAVVRVRVKGNKLGTYIAKGKVYANADDPNGGNNQVSATILVKKRVGGASGTGDGSGGSGSGGGSGGTGGGSGGSGGGSGGGSAGSMQVPDPQRVLKTGGVSLTIKAAKSGTLRVKGSVRSSQGTVKLVSVTRRGVKAGSKQKLFLGTRPADLEKLRTALKGGGKLPASISATLGGQGLKTTTHLTR